MNKKILASLISVTALTSLAITPALAQEDTYSFRYPVVGNGGNPASGGTGGDTGGDTGDTGGNTGDGSETGGEDPAYCDVNDDQVQQWDSAGVTSSSARDNDLFLNPSYYFTSNTNGLDGTQLPNYPSKCFETISMSNTIGGLDFLTPTTNGDSLSLGSISAYQTADYSGVRNIVELNEFNVNSDISDYYLDNSVKIPSDAWLCQPEQEGVFTGLPQNKLCETPEMSPWEQYSYDLSQIYTSEDFSYGDWNSIVWSAGSSSDPLEDNLPSESYPVSNPDTVDLSGFDFENIGGLALVDSVASLYLGELNNDLVDLSNFTFEVSNTIHLPSGVEERSGFEPIPSDAFLCQPENSSVYASVGAQQVDVCQQDLSFEYNWDNYLEVIKGGYTDPSYGNITLDYDTYDVNKVADLYYNNTSEKFTFDPMCEYSNYDCTLIESDFSFDTQLPTIDQDPYPLSEGVDFALYNSSHIDNVDSLRSASSMDALYVSGNSGITTIDLSNNGSAQHSGLLSAGYIAISNNQNLKTIKLNSLLDLQRLVIENNPNLETIEIKNLSVLGPMSNTVDFVIKDNPMLSNIDIGSGTSTIEYGQIVSQPLEIDLTGNDNLSDITFLQNIDYSNDTFLDTTVNIDPSIVDSGFIKLSGSVCNVRKQFSGDTDSEALSNGYYDGRFNVNTLDVCDSVNFIN